MQINGFLEDNLDTPLRDVLEHLQGRFTSLKTRYFGIKTHRNPLDFWVYQEIICSHKPDVVIEIGNLQGGSALAYAHLFDQLGNGRVIAVDINHSRIHQIARAHERITWIESDAPTALNAVKAELGTEETVMIIEDSSHTYDNTLAVLRGYSSLVSPGFYFIVEDSICHHGLDVGPDPGPYEAIETFIDETDEFLCDREMESMLLTWNPKGFLKRINAE